ncbi:MAG: MATE family efflux transporter [Treponema sp.]|nr:MATE family efflux transporter [Spirochaetia bacterium]MDY4152779.1 MATE family efflux transporter [Treponema sp.]
MNKNSLDMTEGPIVAKLMAFSVPLILSNILQLLFNACDVIVVGKFSGDESLAAVGSTSVIINLLTNLFMGLSIGTNVVCSNFFGAKKSKELNIAVHTAIFLSIISGIFLTVIAIPLVKPILILMSSPEDVFPKAKIYLKIYFCGMTSTMIYNFGSAVLRAKGDTKRPLLILILSGSLNVVLNLIFVILFKMDVTGVSLATVISQTLSAFLIIFLLMHEPDDFKLNLKNLKLNRDIVIKIVKIGVPAGLQGIIFSLSNMVIQTSVNSFGKIAVAGNSASQSLEGFVYISMNSIAQGTLTFTSQNLGAGKISRIKKVIFYSQMTAFLFGLVLGNLIYYFAKPLLSLYTDTPESVAVAMVRMKYICTTYGLCGLMDCAANLIRALGHSMTPMLITLFGACGFRILWIFTVFRIPEYHSLDSIYVSYCFSWVVTYLILMSVYFFIFKKELKNSLK